MAIEPADGGFVVTLDGRRIKTPAGRALVVLQRPLAEAIAAEWERQETNIRPHTMPHMSLASTAIDRVGPQRDHVIDEIAGYGETDLLCYRADLPADLAARQQALWQPLLDWAILRFDAPLTVTSGVMPVAQRREVLTALHTATCAFDDFQLAVLHLVTASCGSVVLGLALLEGIVDGETAFALSRLDETFQIERWGEDAEAAKARAATHADVTAAAQFLRLLKG